MNPEISIIIPVYNAGKYLEECIMSLINQSFQNFEVLLINDGSTDNSGIICRNYVEQDKRIRYIEQENKGVCKARNLGLDNARGRLITFVDSDDWLPKNGLELLYREYEKNQADLVVGNMDFVKGKNVNTIQIFDKSFFTSDKSWINMYQKACIGYGYNPNPGNGMRATGLGSMGNKLYRRDIIEKYQLRFDPYTLGIYEDNLFVLHYLEYCDSVSYVSESVYYYRKVSNSNSRGYKERTLEISERIFEKINEFILKYKTDQKEEFYKAMYIYIIRRLDNSLSNYFFAKENNKSFIRKLKELKKLINSEPYKTAINNVDAKRLNPKDNRFIWITAKTNSALVIWCGFQFRNLVRKILFLAHS